MSTASFAISFDGWRTIFSFAANVVVLLCTGSVLIAVLIDFIEFHKRNDTKKEKKSIVETGTMLMFFAFFYLILRSGIGRIDLDALRLDVLVPVIGLFVLIIGCIVNIRGRLALGNNWSNQIKIYQDHTFVSHGVYRFVRHPLYASIIWMFLGASFVYANAPALAATIFLFIPFMSYRSKQEENALMAEFPDYAAYRRRVGMFFPKIFKNL